MKYSASALAILAGMATSAHAITVDVTPDPHIIQIGVTGVDVQQDILVTATGDPSYYDDQSGTFPFFEEYSRVLTKEAGVWDQSQIPSSPIGASSNVISSGQLDAVWTFDASVLKQDLTQFFGEDGVVLGGSDQLSTFEVSRDGMVVGGGVTTSTQVFAGNNILVGEQINHDGLPEPVFLDIIALVADPNPSFDFEPGTEGSGGVTLILSGGENWFEEAEGDIPDFSEIFVGEIEYIEHVFGDSDGDGVSDVPLFEERVSGQLTGGDIFIRDFGAADGSAEDSPLLPDVAHTIVQGVDGENLASPVFGFDLAEATRVQLDGFDAEVIFIDPEIAVGYTYALTGAGEVTGMLAPTLAAVNDADGFQVTVNGVTFTIQAGEYVSFADKGVVGPVTEFTVTGIDQDLMIDPSDATTFVAGFSFLGDDASTVFSQQAIVFNTDPVAPIPLPAGLPLLLAGVGGLTILRRRSR